MQEQIDELRLKQNQKFSVFMMVVQIGGAVYSGIVTLLLSITSFIVFFSFYFITPDDYPNCETSAIFWSLLIFGIASFIETFCDICVVIIATVELIIFNIREKKNREITESIYQDIESGILERNKAEFPKITEVDNTYSGSLEFIKMLFVILQVIFLLLVTIFSCKDNCFLHSGSFYIVIKVCCVFFWLVLISSVLISYGAVRLVDIPKMIDSKNKMKQLKEDYIRKEEERREKEEMEY